MEDCETGVLAETRCGTEESDQKLQSDCAHIEMSKWYVSCTILHLERDRKPENWKKLHVGRINGISCQHWQMMMTKLLQKKLGMTRRKSSRVETWQCDAAKDVFGKLGHQGSIR